MSTSGWDFSHRWSTADEVTFLRTLHAKDYRSFRRYADIVVAGMRTFDPTVDVSRVRAVAEELRGVVVQ